MSPLAIFIVGVIIFSITVYGAVMAGGLALTRRQLDENVDLDVRDHEAHSQRLPLNIKY